MGAHDEIYTKNEATARLRICRRAHSEFIASSPPVRPSARVSKVAELLDDDPSQIRRMIARGDLEAHRQGKRGVRVYLDSVENWQRNNPIRTTKSGVPRQPNPPTPRSGTTNTAHRRAVAHLQALGLVQSSRP
jgi:excisionase family DNA binding protein